MTPTFEVYRPNPRFISPPAQHSSSMTPCVNYGDGSTRWAGGSSAMAPASSMQQQRTESLSRAPQESAPRLTLDSNYSRGFSYFHSSGQDPLIIFPRSRMQEPKEERLLTAEDSLNILRDYSRRCEMASQAHGFDGESRAQNDNRNTSSGVPCWTGSGGAHDTGGLRGVGKESTLNLQRKMLVGRESSNRLPLGGTNMKSQRDAKKEQRTPVTSATIKSRQERKKVQGIVERFASAKIGVANDFSTAVTDDVVPSPAPSRLVLLRGTVRSTPVDASPMVQIGKNQWSSTGGVRSSFPGDSVQKSRIEELRQHLEKYKANDNEVAARPLQLLHHPQTQSLVSKEWPAVSSVGLDDVSPLVMLQGKHAADSDACVSRRRDNGASLPHNISDAKTSASTTCVNLGNNPLHVVFDTCSILVATIPSLDFLIKNSIVCIPYAVVSELDRWNTVKTASKREAKKRKNMGFVARRLRDWMVSSVEQGSNIRLQRRCEVNTLYNSTVSKYDDSILGFAVFLEQEQARVAFVTEDKFLRLKAVSELKGNVYNWSEFSEVRLF